MTGIRKILLFMAWYACSGYQEKTETSLTCVKLPCLQAERTQWQQQIANLMHICPIEVEGNLGKSCQTEEISTSFRIMIATEP